MAISKEDQVFTRDTISGQTAWVPRDYLDIFPSLEEVDEDTKPRHPKLHAETDKDGKDADGKQVREPKKASVPEAKPANTVN